MNLFDFLVIGGQKCGTTWLHFLCDQHPEIFVPNEKEVHYFNYLPNFDKGDDWYEAKLLPNGPVRLRGECTPNYFWNYLTPGEVQTPNHILDIAPAVAARNPDAKIVLVMRDPIARAISAWHHHIGKGRMKPKDGLVSQLDRFGIRSMGAYVHNLRHWLQHFDRDQMLILNFERDIRDSPEIGMQKVFDYMGVPVPADIEYREPRNKRASYLSMQLANYVDAQSIPGKILREISGFLVPADLDKKFKPSPTPEELAALRSYYQPLDQELFELIGEDWSANWTTTHPR